MRMLSCAVSKKSQGMGHTHHESNENQGSATMHSNLRLSGLRKSMALGQDLPISGGGHGRRGECDYFLKWIPWFCPISLLLSL